MEKMMAAYGALYDAIAGSKWEEGLCKPQKDSEYTTFTAMCGRKYFDTKDQEGKDFRFMLVGRTVNGWDEYRKDEELYLTRENFIESSIMNLINEKATITFGSDRFEWIDTSADFPQNTARKGIDRGSVNGDYKLSRAQIWSYTKDVWDSLYGKKTEWKERWFENIVWSNLYKIAPHESGNPGGRLQSCERKACIQLLQAEIDYFKPTHIYFATAREYWFNEFATIFSDFQKKGTNVYSGEKKNEEYVEATARYIYQDGSSAKVVVACRPEGRTKEKYVREVVNFFE